MSLTYRIKQYTYKQDMFRPLRYIKAVAAALAIVAALPAFASHPRHNGNGTWTFHSTFDNEIRKIFDTPDATYFLVGQTPFSKTGHGSYYSRPNGSFFIYDKSNPGAGLQDFAKLAPTSGFDIRQAAVDPATGLMVIAYSDGGIDLITADRKVTYLDNLKNLRFQDERSVVSITFDPVTHDVWLSTATGFIHVDYATLKPALVADYGRLVTDICPAGDYVMAIMGGTVYAAPADADLRYADAFKPVAGAVDLNPGPARLLPLDADNVGFLRYNGGIWLLHRADGQWKASGLGGDGTMLKPEDKRVINSVEHTAMPTANGYYMASASKAHFLERPAAPGGKATLRSVALPAGSSQYSASYDGAKFWFYRERGEFVTRTLSGSEWSEPSDAMRPACPLVARDMQFAYSPRHGFIASNRLWQWKDNCLDRVNPMMVTALRGGKWTDLSPTYHAPYITDTDPAARKIFDNERNEFPLCDPIGFAVDPLNPDVAVAGSLYWGVPAVYLDDPRRNPVMIKGDKRTYGRYDPFKPYYQLPLKTGWDEFNATAVAGFDSDNNMWMYHNLNYIATDDDWYLHFICWPADARRAVLADGDTSRPSGLVDIYVPFIIGNGVWVNARVLSHPANGNRIVCCSHSNELDGATLRVFDHNNTLDDDSDDSLELIKRFNVRNNGTKIFSPTNIIVENPLNGDVLVSNSTDILIFNVNDPITDYTIDARTLTLTGENGNDVPVTPNAVPRDLCIDEYGRIWVAYQNAGVFGVNPDYRGVFAYYTAQNSGLPDNNVSNLGWNPETKTLFISTDYGLVEVKPDQPGDVLASMGTSAPFMTPQAVSADFTGNVSLHNVPAGVALRVRDADGRTVAALPETKNGTTFWNLLDADGNLVPTGRYTISDASGNNLMPEFTLPVVR